MEAEVGANKDKAHGPLLGIVLVIGGLFNPKMIHNTQMTLQGQVQVISGVSVQATVHSGGRPGH